MGWCSASQTSTSVSLLEGLLKLQAPEFLIVLVWAGTAQERASLTCSQEMLLQLVWGPHSESQ